MVGNSATELESFEELIERKMQQSGHVSPNAPPTTTHVISDDVIANDHVYHKPQAAKQPATVANLQVFDLDMSSNTVTLETPSAPLALDDLWQPLEAPISPLNGCHSDSGYASDGVRSPLGSEESEDASALWGESFTELFPALL